MNTVYPVIDSPIPTNQQGRPLVVGAELGTFGYATIQEAINAANSGDVIFVQPGSYTEDLVVTTDYLTIVGGQLGGYGRPDCEPETDVAVTDAALIVRAQGFVCKRMRFLCAASNAVIVEGNGFVFEDCVFDGNVAATSGVRLKGNATDDSMTASEGIIKNCLFRGAAAGLVFDTAEAAVGVGSTHNEITGCRFIDNTQDIVTADTGPGTYSVQDTVIRGCVFLDKNKVNYIDLTTANGGAAGDQTGLIADCFFATDSITTTNIAMVGTGFALVGCYDTVGVQDGSGLD